MTVPVYTLPLPEYTLKPPVADASDEKFWTPDYAILGPIIDRFLIERFAGHRLALRGLFLDDHPELSRDEFIAVIQKLGTDRYDPDRKSIHHDYYEPMGVELHVCTCEITDKIQALDDEDYMVAPSFMGEYLADFFESALSERGYSLRIDLLVAYDLDQLVAVPVDEPHGYAFKNPGRKPEALVGIVNILRGD